MKAEHRKELETNILADKMGKLITGAKHGPSRGFLFYAVIGLVSVAALFLLYRYFATSSTRSGPQWYKFEDGSQEAVIEVVTKGGNDTPSKAARFQLAYENLWIYGIKSLGGSNPAAAKRKIEEAEDNYKKLAELCKDDPVFQPEALYALAVIEETKAINFRDKRDGEEEIDYIAEALAKYKAVVKANSGSAFAQLAQQRIDELENEDKNRDIRRFYQDLRVTLRRNEMPVFPPGMGKIPPAPPKE